MKTNIASGATLAVAAIALAMGACPPPRLPPRR